MKIPSLILKQMYTFGSLKNTEHGIQFGLKNRLADATVTGLVEIAIDGRALPLDRVVLDFGGGERRKAADIDAQRPVQFPLRKAVTVEAPCEPLAKGDHEVVIEFASSFMKGVTRAVYVP